MKTIARERLVSDLLCLGIAPGDCVMLHSSLSRIGYVDGGAATVVEAFLNAVGEEGTLLTPAFTEGAWVEHLAMPDCRDVCPQPLCPSTFPSHEGAIPNAALNRPGRLRSCHPTHSWVANGADAYEVLKDHMHSPSICGSGNPFEGLCERDGCIVTLGVGVDRITLWHYFEDLTDAPYKGHYHEQERHLSYCTAGRRIQYEFPGVIQDVIRASGIMRFGKVGRAEAGLIKARQFRRFLATVMTADPYCMILRPPDRENGNIAEDAMMKAAAMLQAWRDAAREPPPNVHWYPGKDDDCVCEDCPAFAGFHNAETGSIPLCRANGRHPDFFRQGGAFAENGPTTCGRCPWHHRFPKGD